MAVTRNDQSRSTPKHYYSSRSNTAILAAHPSSRAPSMDDNKLPRVMTTIYRLISSLSPTNSPPVTQTPNNMARICGAYQPSPLSTASR